MRRWLLIFLGGAVCAGCCATAGPQLTVETARAARFAHAAEISPCAAGRLAGGSPDGICIDADAFTWSACAWNACGHDEACRKRNDAEVAAGSCGGDEWPPCKPGGVP